MVIDDNLRIIHFSHTPELGQIYEKFVTVNEETFKEKREFELFIAQIISTHDYSRIRPIISMALTPLSPLDFKNPKVVYYTVGIIALLTRVAIIDGVSEKYAYSLSDTYLTLNFQELKVDPIEFIYEISVNFMKLIENVSHFSFKSLLVTRVTNYIYNNITQKFSIKGLADIFEVTPEHLSTHFKIITGLSLKDFINREKMNHAKFLLVSTDMSLLEITLELGYTDQSYFSKLFKSYTQKTPLKYKRDGKIKLKENFSQS